MTLNESALVIDTDVASFLFNQDPVRMPRYEPHTEGRTIHLPFAVAGEMLFGAELRGWGEPRKTELVEYLAEYVFVEASADIAQNWATIRAHAQGHGQVIPKQDAWIAAVAVTLNLPLLTHNAAHFTNVPLLRVITEPDK